MSVRSSPFIAVWYTRAPCAGRPAGSATGVNTGLTDGPDDGVGEGARTRAPESRVAAVPPPTTATSPAPPSRSRRRRSSKRGWEEVATAAAVLTGPGPGAALKLRTNSAQDAGRASGALASPRDKAASTAEVRSGLIEWGGGSGLWI